MDRPEDSELIPEARAAGSRSERRGRLGPLLRILLFFLLGLLLLGGGFLGWSALDRADPLDLVPDGFSAWARAESAYELLSSLVGLEAAELILSDPALRQARRTLLALRASPLLDSPLARRLAGVRVDAALYPGGSWLAVARLGARSAALRLALGAGSLGPRLARLEGLSFAEDGGLRRLELRLRDKEGREAPPLFIASRRDLLLLASSRELLGRALDGGGRREGDEELRRALSSPLEGSLRLLVRPEDWLGALRGREDRLASLLGELSFPAYAGLDLEISRESLSLSLALPVEAEDPALAELLSSRSAAPAILSLLPASLRYASVLAAGRPGELLGLAESRLGPDFPAALERAEKASRLAFGVGLEELLFGWAGGELGLLGLGEGAAPVFFVRVAGEAARRRAFERITASLLVEEGRSAEVEGIRLERIELPWFLEGLLSALGLSLPEPWYHLAGGFLFLSESPAALGSLGAAIRDRDFLARTERWKRSGGAVPAAAAVELLYSLDEAIPFFLRGSSRASEALRLYRDGVATLRFDGGQLRLALAARVGEGRGAAPLPGFPVKAEGRLGSAALALEVRGRSPLLYWIEGGETLVEYEPSSGERREASLGEESFLALEPGRALWAVSSRGAVYRFLPGLEAAAGFPLATGYAPSAPPAWGGEALLLPIREPAGLLALDRGGGSRLLASGLEAPLLSPPAVRGASLAFYPKRFDGLLHLLEASGAEAPGWPVEAPGLGFGSPLLLPWEGGSLGFLSQAGELHLLPAAEPRGQGRRELLLEGVFYGGLVYAPGSDRLYALSEEGRIWRVGRGGEAEPMEAPEEGGLPRGKDARLLARDLDGDGREELFLYGAGGRVAAFSPELIPIEGFPLAGGREPAFADLDGDGSLDLISAGFDNRVYAWEFRR